MDHTTSDNPGNPDASMKRIPTSRREEVTVTFVLKGRTAIMESTTNNNARVAIMDKLDEADQHFRISPNDVCHLLMDRIQPLQRMFLGFQQNNSMPSRPTLLFPWTRSSTLKALSWSKGRVLNQLSRDYRLDTVDETTISLPITTKKFHEHKRRQSPTNQSTNR